MAEIRTVTTLRYKRVQITATIAKYEKRIAQARADLSHINACIAIFEADTAPSDAAPYIDVHRLFERGEPMRLCKQALASGPKSTKELALHVMAAKGMDTSDKVPAHAVAGRLRHALRQQWRRGLISGEGKIKGARIWATIQAPPNGA
jgi:hypothetical protein